MLHGIQEQGGGLPPGAPPGAGGPPPGGPPMGPPPNSSVLNPGDMALAGQQGRLNPDMSVIDWLAQMGIRPEDKIGEALEKMKMQAQNATGIGKAQSAGPPGGMPPGGPPPGAGPQGPPPGGLDSLMG